MELKHSCDRTYAKLKKHGLWERRSALAAVQKKTRKYEVGGKAGGDFMNKKTS